VATSIPTRFADYQVKDQVAAVIIDQHNFGRETEELEALQNQDEAFLGAMEQIDKVREFVGSPENILGSDETKHGEIAEQVEVGIGNARKLIEQEPMNATFVGVPRLAPVDYKIDNIGVQSKFWNGPNNSLSGIQKHMEKYPDFTDGNSYYQVPEDQYEIMQKINSGEDVSNLNGKTVQAISDKIDEITKASGREFDDVVRPSLSRYDDVQQGRVHQTLDNNEQDIDTRNTEINQSIEADHSPSGLDAVAPVGVAAVVGGAVSLTSQFYSKYREGKNPFKGDFSAEDWKEVGLTTAQGTAGGAVAGGGIYLLTNYADLSAPFAGAVVSGIKGIASLTQQYQAGQITQEQYIQLGMITCAESACVGIGAAIGQTLIPVPVLGTVIGSVAGKMLVEVSRDFRMSKEIQQKIIAEMNAYLDQLNESTKAEIEIIIRQYEQLSDILKAAFDPTSNMLVKFERSIDVAKLFGGDGTILTSPSEIDNYFLD
jgi:hypothetical protein